MSYVVAIPTHNRAAAIGEMSLNFILNDVRVEPSNVYVFVSNSSQLNEYINTIGHTGVNIVNANTTTARDKFNFIHSYFISNEDVLVVEDDVKGFVKLIDRSSATIIRKGFEIMHKEGKKIWGIYPSSNKMFMQATAQTGYLFLVANVYGFVANGNEKVLVQEEAKTDYERSILYAIYEGGMIRLNYVAARTNNYTTKGGMQDLPNRYEIEERSCENLVRRFPNHCSYKKGTKSKYPEIKLTRL